MQIRVFIVKGVEMCMSTRFNFEARTDIDPEKQKGLFFFFSDSKFKAAATHALGLFVCFLEGAFAIGRAKHCATQKRTWCLPGPRSTHIRVGDDHAAAA
jgi:hypothetical protein